MPCNRLAVQTATLTENVAAVLMDPTVVQMLAQAFAKITGDAEVRVTSNVGGRVYDRQRPLAEIVTPDTQRIHFYGRNIGVVLSRDGRITTVDGFYGTNTDKALARSVVDQFAQMVRGAASIATQNLILQAMAAAGVKLTGETLAANGARVVSFAL
jgi:hypothetical protein